MTTQRTVANEQPDQYITPGHLACPGCGATLAMQWVLSVLGKDTVLGLPACCFSIISGAFPHTPMNVNLVHTAFETGAALATGLKAGLEATGRGHAHVVSWAGDGGTFDIGLQALSGAAERNEDIIYVCYDNEAYMNTGNQRSSATPRFARTTTSPTGETMHKKDIMAIMAAHSIPYAASASISHPDDLIAKVERAKEIRGTRFLHILVACPTGWRMPSDMTITAARLAVESGIFPLIEIENGERITVNHLLEERIPVSEYLAVQGRFSGISKEDIADIQRWVDEKWERLLKTADIAEG
jgi:pyruvate ferredoxin oxidoreductase beta subunit/2-oxoisovalerate ferredoxin oxidoreductase beta subunit